MHGIGRFLSAVATVRYIIMPRHQMGALSEAAVRQSVCLSVCQLVGSKSGAFLSCGYYRALIGILMPEVTPTGQRSPGLQGDGRSCHDLPVHLSTMV